ncbi:mCG61825, partial [Mus musculus]
AGLGELDLFSPQALQEERKAEDCSPSRLARQVGSEVAKWIRVNRRPRKRKRGKREVAFEKGCLEKRKLPGRHPQAGISTWAHTAKPLSGILWELETGSVRSGQLQTCQDQFSFLLSIFPPEFGILIVTL